jgi:hypothetical protein
VAEQQKYVDLVKTGLLEQVLVKVPRARAENR